MSFRFTHTLTLVRGLLLVLLILLFVGGLTPPANAQTMPPLPPGFSGTGLLPTPVIWTPSSPSQCDAVYVPALTQPVPYRIQGGGNPVPNEINYFFYFTATDQVFSFIDPRPAHIYAKDVLDGDYGIAINFTYPGGFPNNFNGMNYDTLFGTVTYPIPGDKWSRVVVTTWPFIKRTTTTYNIPQHCRLNGNCYCLK